MRPTAERVTEILSRFSGARIAVVGDFVADVYLEATPSRLSREAPVMVVTWRNEEMIPGGAANAVHNLVSLGASVVPVGVLGQDAAGQMLGGFFRDQGMTADGIVIQADYGTVAKTRVMVGEEGRSRQQILRIDREPSDELRPETRAELKRRLAEILPGVDALLFSDYGYGIIDSEMIEMARSRGTDLLVAADSRYRMRSFRGVDVITPNHSEAADLVGGTVLSDEEVESAGSRLLNELGVGIVLVTRGNRGMMLVEGQSPPLAIPASGPADEVTDVSGAGDTVICVMTLALVAGATPAEAARLSNDAAGVVVTRLGAATVSPAELLDAATRER